MPSAADIFEIVRFSSWVSHKFWSQRFHSWKIIRSQALRIRHISDGQQYLTSSAYAKELASASLRYGKRSGAAASLPTGDGRWPCRDEIRVNPLAAGVPRQQDNGRTWPLLRSANSFSSALITMCLGFSLIWTEGILCIWAE